MARVQNTPDEDQRREGSAIPMPLPLPHAKPDLRIRVVVRSSGVAIAPSLPSGSKYDPRPEEKLLGSGSLRNAKKACGKWRRCNIRATRSKGRLQQWCLHIRMVIAHFPAFPQGVLPYPLIRFMVHPCTDKSAARGAGHDALIAIMIRRTRSDRPGPAVLPRLDLVLRRDEGPDSG
ncbi:hypothetical protein EI94DRAFT_1789447 [Lactarius quietus]|nr:hypothetical protein EI94DRAFT_1789447 [Lactarius quietus]